MRARMATGDYHDSRREVPARLQERNRHDGGEEEMSATLTTEELAFDIKPAIDNLTECQRQLDADGCEVGVSRQALDEVLAHHKAQAAEIEQLRKANSVRPDYPLYCGDCGRAHILDTVLPSDIWNQIADPADILCTTCIDRRLGENGLTETAQFFYVGAALKSELYAEHLVAEVERLEKLVYVPGLWRCAKCNFTLIQRNLNAADGTVTDRDTPGDKCPNCAGPLWRVSERDERREMDKRAEELFARATAAEAKVAALTEAGQALIDDVRRRYPGEELRCPYMIALDAALGAKP